ncbi:MAG: sugar transferase [Sporichthyaceae bacterium]
MYDVPGAGHVAPIFTDTEGDPGQVIADDAAPDQGQTAQRWQRHLGADSAIPEQRDGSSPLIGLNYTHVPSSPPTRIWRRRYTVASVTLDLLAAVAAASTAELVRFGVHPPAGYVAGSVAAVIAWMALLAVCGAYQHRLIGVGTAECRRALLAGLLLMAGIAFTSYATKSQFSRGFVVIAIPTVIVLSILARLALRTWLHRQWRGGRYVQRTLLVGSRLEVGATIDRLRGDTTHGMLVVGACIPGGNRTDACALQVPVISEYADIETGVAGTRSDVVTVLSSAMVTGEELRRLSWRLEGSHTDLVVCSGLTETFGTRVTIRPTAHSPMLHVARPRLTGPSRVVKGAFDRLGAGLGLLLISPLFFTIALAIWAHDRHSPFFRQIRVGLGGGEFGMWKFRSMVPDAEARKAELMHLNEADGALFKIVEDPRLTPIGRWLRRYSIDEFPQLINVLSGHMSLVGPRPPLREETEAYGHGHRRRLLVKPGMTGLWQVSGRSDLSWEESEQLDLRYVENWSLVLDLHILFRTARAVMRREGAY